VTLINRQVTTPRDAAPEAVTIFSLKQSKEFPGLQFLNRVNSIKNQLKNELQNYDFVWSRSFTMALAASKILGKHKVIYINAAPQSFYDNQTTFKENLKIYRGILGLLRILTLEISFKISWMLERQAIKNCLNVYLSKARRDQTLSFFCIKNKPAKFFVIPAGVNIIRFQPSKIVWNGNGTFQLISVCRLCSDKNIQCVIQAIALLIADEMPIHLTIVGEGPFENELHNLVKDLGVDKHIDFVGRQENIEEWYQKNHVFVLPSLYEGFGSVYVEAMASGLPCIAISNKNKKYNVAADEIIDAGINGLLMKENDSVELSLLIKSLFEDPAKYNKFSLESRKSVIKNYTWNKITTEILKISK